MQTIRTCLLALAALFISYTGLSAQGSYQNYFNSTYQWYEYGVGAIFSYQPCSAGGTYNHSHSYHITGTDSLDGFHWYTMHHDWQEEFVCTFGPTILNPPQGTAGTSFRMREDSTGKIWIRQYNGSITMQYDFRSGILVGDTLWMNDYQHFCEVILIDSVSLGPERRARYWCEDCGFQIEPNRDVYVVEGVGFNEGFFHTEWVCDAPTAYDGRLTCCSKDSASLVVDATYPCFGPGHVVVGLDEGGDADLKLSWHALSERILVSNLDPMEPRTWTVYDVQGKQIAKGERLQEEIHLPGLVSGMYIFVAEPVGNEKPIVWRFLR